MAKLDSKTKEALLESLYDLKHDLGKYIKMPVAMLPKDAPWEEVKTQTVKAVTQTRKGPEGEISAVVLFKRFADEWEAVLSDNDAYREIARSVNEAAALPSAIEKGKCSSRDEIEQTLGGVAAAISALTDEVVHG